VREPEPERAVPPASRFIEPDIKPRVAGFQGFSDFEQETTQFLGKRNTPSFEDEFPDFGTPYRSPLSATAGEVMAGIASDAKAQPTRTPTPPPPDLVDEEPLPADAKSNEADDKDQFKKRRRRSKGKERSGSEENGGTETAIESPKIDDRPISFEDVPFMPPEPAKATQPVFHDWTPERPKPAPQPVHPRHIEKEMPRQEEPAPVATKPPVRDFGFGIFDE